MLKNYFIVAWRNLKKNRLTSFINISGLTISICICLLITLFIHDEINYDTFEKDFGRVYRAEQAGLNGGVIQYWAASPGPLKDLLLDKFPEVESAARLLPSPFAFINVGDKKFKEENCFLADSTIFEVLGLTLVQGDPSKALSEPNSVVLTETMAARLFGQQNAMHQTLTINSTDLKVTGILKDLPPNSHLQFTSLRSMEMLSNSGNGAILQNWGANAIYTYVRLKKGANPSLMPDKISEALLKEQVIQKKSDITYHFHEISKIHLDGNIEKEITQNSSWIFIYIFVTVGILILLLASINYINLTTSRSIERSREIGVRKTLGAFKKNLIAQFITESVLITLLSYAIALLVTFIMLPAFNSITGKHLSLLAVINPFFILVSAGIIIFIGILAGIYPAFIISSFDPVNTLKGIVNTNIQSRFSFGLRKGLVIFQFVVSAFLVVSSLVVIKQITYMFDKPLGYSKENVMVLPAYKLTDAMLVKMKNELETDLQIKGVSATSAVPGKRVMIGGVKFGEKEPGSIRTMFVDMEFLKAMHMEILKGRDFNENISSDTAEAAVVNEAAVKQFELKNPVGSDVQIDFARATKKCKIIGVVKDFHYGSLHNSIEPVVLSLYPFYTSIVIKYEGDVEQVKKAAATAWNHIYPDELFTYTVLEDDLKTLYRSETTSKELLIIFTILAIIIASMGLFGLIFFSNTLRRKEIGIRKVLGADNGAIVYLLSKEYIFLIVISLAFSLPLSGYALHKWLNNFAYRTDISLTVFLSGTIITLVIAFVTVFMQGMQAALSSPVKNLRTE
jgi:putative ABC transport system permease protein